MSTGKLFIVGTPIGYMGDITLRALRVLREADLIAAEDICRTAQLLARHGISISEDLVGRDRRARRSPPPEGLGVGKPRRLVSYHQFNEAKRTPELLHELQQGRTIALVSDAGMPTISDPGQRLIQAVLTPLSGSRLPCTPKAISYQYDGQILDRGKTSSSLAPVVRFRHAAFLKSFFVSVSCS